MAPTTIDLRDPAPGDDPHGAPGPTAGPLAELVTSCRAITPDIDARHGARCLQVSRAA